LESSRQTLSFWQTIYMVATLLFFPAMLFLLAGDWTWIAGWIFAVWFFTLCVTTIIYLFRKDPALLQERFKHPGAANQKSWDKYVVFGIMILFTGWYFIMPLDAKRFAWTVGFPLECRILGGLVLIPAFLFYFRAFVDNPYLSPLVRIQSERHQTVVSTGVYAFVRHPMYFGAGLMMLGAPLLLGSRYGLLIAVAFILLLAFRILGEERTLVTELEGYAEYRKKVKYRLIPFIW
jgi:protein-S-isoprenylcysteine O-methyltransferase Ste14